MADWHEMRHFEPAEFKCRCGTCGSDGTEMDLGFIFKLDKLRQLAGFPFHITSGYRCPAYNQQVSTTGADGPHTTGHAADVLLMGSQVHYLLRNATWAMTGIGLKQHGPADGRFIHLDDLDQPGRPWIWTY